MKRDVIQQITGQNRKFCEW